MKETIEQILEMYVDENSKRGLNEPFLQDGYIYATNGYILLRSNNLLIKPNDHIKVLERPYCGNLFKNIPESYTITIEEINSMLINVPMIDETKSVGKNIMCKECQGEGIVEWEYKKWTKDFDCPVCDGEGYSETTKEICTGNQIRNPEHPLSILGKDFLTKYIEVLQKTILFFNVDTIKVGYNENLSLGTLFRINENIDVLIMPCLNYRNNF